MYTIQRVHLPFMYLKIDGLGMLYGELEDDGDNSSRLSGATNLEFMVYSFFCVPAREP